MGPGEAQLPGPTPTTDNVVVPQVSIAPLTLIHPLLYSPLLSLVSYWNLIKTRVLMMGMDCRVAPFLQWLRAQATSQETSNNILTSVDITNDTLQAWKYMRNILVPSPPPIPLIVPVHYLSRPPVVMKAPPLVKPDMVSVERWGEETRSLLRLCNVMVVGELPPIWETVSPISCHRSQVAMEV